MTESNAVNVAIGKDLISPILNAKISAAVIEAIGDREAFVERAVIAMLNQKVDSEGRFNKDDYYCKHDMVEQLSHIAVRDAVKGALEEFFEKAKPIIQAAVLKEIKKRPTKIATALIEAVYGSIHSRYGFTFQLELKARD